MEQVRRSARPRMMKKKSDILYFDDQKIELNEEEKDLLYPNDKIREKTYCFCKRTEEEAVGLTMIECDSCHDWFHDECIGIPQSEMELLDIYYCPSCLSKPIKYSKREPSNADLDLLLTALEELTEEKPKIKKKETRLNFPKVTLFHFFEPVMINYLTVAGFMKNESSSVNEDNKIIVPITKEDLEKGTLWTSWGNYRIAACDGKIQATSELSIRSPLKSDEKCESPVIKTALQVETRENTIELKIGDLDPLIMPVRNLGFSYKEELSQKILDGIKCESFEKMRETFYNLKFRPAGVIKLQPKNIIKN